MWALPGDFWATHRLPPEGLLLISLGGLLSTPERKSIGGPE
jgi:hypothetical protein